MPGAIAAHCGGVETQLGEPPVGGPVMSKESGKTLHTVCLALGAFLMTTVFVGGGMLVYQYRDASIDLSPRSFLSKEEVEILSDRQGGQSKTFEQLHGKVGNGANTDYEKMSREVWQRYHEQQKIQDGGDETWKK